MAESDFTAAYQYLAMSTGPGAQSADVSGPWSYIAPPIQQRQQWEQEADRTFPYQTNSPYLPPPPPPPLQYRSSPYPQPDHPQSPYFSYALHGGPPIQWYRPSSAFSFSSHQPRPPPAIRSNHVDALINPSRSGPDLYHGAPANYGSYHTGSQGQRPSAIGRFPYSMQPRPAVMTDNTPSTSLDEDQSVRALSGGDVEQSSQTLPLHPGPSDSNHPQRPDQNQQPPTDRNAATRHVEYAEPQTPRNLTAQARRPDRSSSPRTSARRSFNRYSADLSQSSTSSDVEEAAARSPPSSRIRHRPRESRPRLFSQFHDPNVIPLQQVQELKASLPKLLLGELPEDACPTCDICAKDYSATPVQASEEEEVAVKLPCGHIFGEFCIGQWLDTCKTHKNKVTCPMCRKQLIEPPQLPYAAGHFNSGAYYMYAARSSQSFRELLANELQAQYARA